MLVLDLRPRASCGLHEKLQIIPLMKLRFLPAVIRVSICGIALATASQAAAQSIKADNPDALDQTSSWTNNTVPTGALATWENTITAANTSSIGTGVSFSGIQVTNPNGAVTINAGTGGTLTLGGAGIDLAKVVQIAP
jgi:hypothetical protein